MSTVFIGLMSGTSLDGVDGVAVAFADADAGTGAGAATVSVPGPLGLHVLAHAHAPFALPLKAELLALNRASDDEIRRAALAANALARHYATVVETLLEAASLERSHIAAIGAHGQTIRHRPGEFDGIGFTTQLNAPALLAELGGIDVIADFRSRDVAAGGQGAPLAPAFHRAFFWTPGRAVAVLNLGGIANLSAIASDGELVGFDCGPANALLDHWCFVSTGQPIDRNGAFSASGQVDGRLLDTLLAEPFFAMPAPKSTGRDLFDAEWLEARLASADARARLRDEDIQATLAELTARTCADACRGYASTAAELVVCGGGAHNADVLARLRRLLAPLTVVESGQRGLAPDRIEATAFAWLARQFTLRRAGNVPSVTGAAGPRILGALYPAR